MLDFVRLRID